MPTSKTAAAPKTSAKAAAKKEAAEAAEQRLANPMGECSLLRRAPQLTFPPEAMRLGFAVKVLGQPGIKSNDTRRWQQNPHLRVSLGYLCETLWYLRSWRSSAAWRRPRMCGSPSIHRSSSCSTARTRT
jgi:UV DNA damage endonuclease